MSGPIVYACPTDHAVLNIRGESAQCPACHSTFHRTGNIWRFVNVTLDPYRSFIETYRVVRRAEGWGSTDALHYLDLPHVAPDAPHAKIWRVRAVTFKSLLRHLARPSTLLDVGAGNGWLSYQLLKRGHTMVSLDLNDDARDGLGAREVYPLPLECAQADMQQLPFAGEQFDAVIFNASLHYTTNLEGALESSLRVLKPDGKLFVMDSPMYRERASGDAMLNAKARSFQETYGIELTREQRGYLTFDDFKSVALHWTWHESVADWRTKLRAASARRRGKREPARFGVMVGERLPGNRTRYRMLATLTGNLAVKFNELTNQTIALPILIFYPTARCNSRCISCDWWKSDGADDLSFSEIRALVEELPVLGVRLVVFSGGEPLLRREVFEIADLFRAQGIKLNLLTAGLFLERDAEKIGARFDGVTISLDAHTSALYQKIRGVDALALVERGVQKLRAASPHLAIRARSTLHRHNFRELPHLIDKARDMGLQQISFLSADVTSKAFGRGRGSASTQGLLLGENEIADFSDVVERTIVSHARDFETHFVAESPEKLRRLPRYYAAQLGLGPFPPISCNAPWVSAVIEADGAVHPCYFHQAVGSLRESSLQEILQKRMRAFRAALDVQENAVCKKCVCTLKVGVRTKLW